MIGQVVRLLPVLLGLTAGIIDWRYARIPNWLTMPALVIGIIVNTWSRGWTGAKDSLLGAGLGFALLLGFFALRLLGGGDCKLVGALGAFFGPTKLLDVLFVAVLVNGLMAVFMVIKEGRLLQTLKNAARLLAALFSLRPPDADLTLDNPKSSKVRFGVAVAIAVLLYAAGEFLGFS